MQRRGGQGLRPSTTYSNAIQTGVSGKEPATSSNTSANGAGAADSGKTFQKKQSGVSQKRKKSTVSQKWKQSAQYPTTNN